MSKDAPWYFGVDCASCGARIAVGEDKSHGDRVIEMRGAPGATLRISCPACGAVHGYAPELLTSKPGPLRKAP